MSTELPVLHMLCGKIAAGKSTLAHQLASQPSTVLISEDYWLSRLFKDEMHTVADFIRYSCRLREAMGSHVEALLQAGVSVVLDFHANTVASRQWMRGIIENAGAAHRLHYLDVPDDLCKARLRQRNADGTHEFAVSDAQFDEFTSYFVPPSESEGFEVIVYHLVSPPPATEAPESRH
jgi:predicted kinase